MPAQPYAAQSQSIITPHHRQGRTISLQCGARADNAGVDLRPPWVRARLQTAGKRTPLRLFLLNVVPPLCLAISALPLERTTMARYTTRHLTVPASALPTEAPPSFISYMYVSRRTPAWNALYVCMLYAICGLQLPGFYHVSHRQQ